MFRSRCVRIATAWNQKLDCFWYSPTSRTRLPTTCVCCGWLPLRASGPMSHASRRSHLASRHGPVEPHAAMALSPTKDISLAAMVAFML